ncbi:LOW QUALITY PROTEIN: macrophage colony-stimulating factor 1 [Lissotriton helveticus]
MPELRVYKAERGARSQCSHCSPIPTTHQSPSKDTRTPRAHDCETLRNFATSRTHPGPTVNPRALQEPPEHPTPGNPNIRKDCAQPQHPGTARKATTRTLGNQEPPHTVIMDQSTRDRRRSPPKVQMGLRALLLITCILSASGSNCGNIITPKHLAFMEDLIGNQLQTPCNVTFNFVDLPNMHTDDQQKACYVLRAIPWVGRILKRQTESYTLSSTNFNHSIELKKLYDSLLSEQCLRRDERSTIDAKRCSRTYSMSPRDMLMIVKDVFIITKELLDKKPVECADPYDTCEDLDEEEEPEAITTTGPAQCTCSCPSPGPTGSLLVPVKPGSPQEHSRDPAGMKEKIPTLHLSTVSKEGGIRVARTTQNIPGTPESLKAPDVLETLRTPTVVMLAPTVEPEHVSVLEVHRPGLLSTEIYTGPTLAADHQSASGLNKKVQEDHGSQATEDSSSALSAGHGRLPHAQPGDFISGSPATFFESSARPRSAVTEEAITEQASTEGWSSDSTEVPVSVSEEAAPHQSSTVDSTIFSSEAPVSLSKEVLFHQPSTEERATVSTEAQATYTEEAAHQPQSTDDKTIGSSESPMYVSEGLSLHPLSTEYTATVTIENSVSVHVEVVPLRPSTEDKVIDDIVVPTPVTKDLHQETSTGKKHGLPITATMLVMDEDDPHRISGPLNSLVSTEASVSVTEETSSNQLPSKERTFDSSKASTFVSENSAPHRPSFTESTMGSAQTLMSVTDKQGSEVSDTPKSSRFSTVLHTTESIKATPRPETVVGIRHVPLRPAAPGVFQGRGEGSQQSDERGESSSGPHPDSNLLPLYGPGPDKPPIPGDEDSIGRAHVYLVVPCIVGLLLALSGLFYYRHQNQILRRELQRTAFRTEHQEERPLNTPDSFQLEIVE